MMSNDLTLVETAGLPFLLSVPPGMNAEKSGRWPVLCFLHGYDEGPPTEMVAGLAAHGPLRRGSSPLAAREFIVAAPQLPARGDIWRFHARSVIEVVTFIQDRHNGDRGRTYLTGFSYGGNGVFDVALHDPSVWAALWAVDPTRVPEEDPGLPVWLSSGEASRPRSTDYIERLGLKPQQEGNHLRVYQDGGLDHVGTAASAYRSDTIYHWLLSKRAEAR